MKVELRAPRAIPHLGYWVEVDGQRWNLTQPVVHALIRHGMEAQQRRDAMLVLAYANGNHNDRARAMALRAQPITDEDVVAAVEGEKNPTGFCVGSKECPSCDGACDE